MHKQPAVKVDNPEENQIIAKFLQTGSESESEGEDWLDPNEDNQEEDKHVDGDKKMVQTNSPGAKSNSDSNTNCKCWIYNWHVYTIYSWY